ncbi:MAG TPA: hypothetical protein DCW31_11675 [Lactobacillus sp.]|nr:hypothetical protein [Lactobacillus sp.]
MVKLKQLFTLIKATSLLNIFGGSLGMTVGARILQNRMTHDMLTLRLKPADLNEMLGLPQYTITALATGRPDFFQVSRAQQKRLAVMLDNQLQGIGR